MTTKLNEQIAQGPGETGKPDRLITPSHLKFFQDALNGSEGEMDAWLETADEHDVRAHILAHSAQAQQRIQELEKGLREKAEVAAKEIAKISVGLGCTVGDCNHGKVSDLQAIIARSLLQSSKT